MSRCRPFRRAALLAAGASVLVAGPAAAHPFIGGGEAPIDSLAELTLNMAHGCASEVAGEGDPTIEIALQVPDWMRIVDVPEQDGWSVTLEPDDGAVEVVTWSNPDAEVPDPAVTFDAVVSGEPGDERFLAVFQGCEGDSYRWVGTPDDPADDPAVRLRLVAADPDRPAPSPETPEPDADDGTPRGADEPDATTTPDPADDEAADEQGDPADDDDGIDDDAESSVDPEPAGSDGIGTTPVIIAVLVVVLGGIGVVLLTRRRNVDA